MEIAAKYDPSQVEDKWYGFWMKNRLFRSLPDGREAYCIVIPPPNVTGVLHMGHMLNNTIQDILVRRARMLGKNALWVPGTDHASIATEAKVVAKLKELGIDKSQLSRKEFMDHAWEWKEKHGGIILEQLRKLGASCDWERTCFTMDEARYESVISVFVDLFNKGLIYRGARMINWDPKALTAVSDEEVIYREVRSKLYFIRYRIEESHDEWVVIATTRPETILGDTALCVHPEDARYAHLKGKHVVVPLINRSIPVIFDEYVDREFGTGALKITPAHDINDYRLGLKYRLEVIDTFNPDGTMSEAAQLYIGEDRFKVRTKIVKDLGEQGYIVKIEDYTNKVGYSERTDEVIEPRISVQWFMRMQELAAPALDAVESDKVRFHPSKYKNMYRHWMENVTDWCISRQLWWGQRIPAWYLPGGDFVVAAGREEAFSLAVRKDPSLGIDDLRQDEDVLDTWFSSWLWPISVFDGIRHPENPDISYYFPTGDLVTAPDIIFFWVARMIMASFEYRKDIPFKNVYFTGTVRDKLGRKMSKSLGNSPEPIELINKYGADAVRIGMLLCSPAGNDLLYDNSLVEQGRNFCNKVWNAMRLVKGWEVDKALPQHRSAAISVAWFDSVMNMTLAGINEQFERYRLSEALKDIYKLVWDDFCSWYLEMIKPGFKEPVDQLTHQATLDFFEKLIRVMHPFMPFITEEIYHVLHNSGEDSIMNTAIPGPGKIDQALVQGFDFIRDIIIAVRSVRSEQNISPKDQLELFVGRENGGEGEHTFDEILLKLCNLKALHYTMDKPVDAVSFIVKTTECYIPLAKSINLEDELVKLNEDISYQKGFLESVMKKLGNQRFIDGAPRNVIEAELRKKADAESRIASLEERISSLRKQYPA